MQSGFTQFRAPRVTPGQMLCQSKRVLIHVKSFYVANAAQAADVASDY